MKEKIEKLLEHVMTSNIPDSVLQEVNDSLKVLKLLLLQLVNLEKREFLDEKNDEKPKENEENTDTKRDDLDGEGTMSVRDQKIEDDVEPDKDATNEHDISHSEALDNLEDIATTRKNDSGKREFLLHRGTKDYEYEKGKDGDEFEAEESEWVPEVMSGEVNQKNKNPVVSCWIPEGDIKEIPNPYPANATWGELGANPHRFKYKVIVKPGKYEIYQELKA